MLARPEFGKAKPLNRKIGEKAAVLDHGWDGMNTDEKPEQEAGKSNAGQRRKTPGNF